MLYGTSVCEEEEPTTADSTRRTRTLKCRLCARECVWCLSGGKGILVDACIAIVVIARGSPEVLRRTHTLIRAQCLTRAHLQHYSRRVLYMAESRAEKLT